MGPGVDPDRPMRQRNFRKNDIPGHARRHPAVSCAKMAQPIEMPFGLWAQLGSRNHVLDGGTDSQTGRGTFRIVSSPLQSIEFRGLGKQSAVQ